MYELDRMCFAVSAVQWWSNSVSMGTMQIGLEGLGHPGIGVRFRDQREYTDLKRSVPVNEELIMLRQVKIGNRQLCNFVQCLFPRCPFGLEIDGQSGAAFFPFPQRPYKAGILPLERTQHLMPQFPFIREIRPCIKLTIKGDDKVGRGRHGVTFGGAFSSLVDEGVTRRFELDRDFGVGRLEVGHAFLEVEEELAGCPC
jgi:hypothetical protein